MSRMYRMRWIVLAMPCVVAVGCAQKSGRMSDAMAPEAAMASPPGGDADGGVSQAEDGAAYDMVAPSEEPAEAADLPTLNAELEGLGAELELAVGEAAAASTAPTADGGGPRHKAKKKTSNASRCARISDLQEAICDVAGRICGLAESHDGEAEYADACGRAESRCEVATEAHQTCEGM